MKCQYCGIDLALLRALTDGVFCCDQHRESYERQELVFSAMTRTGPDSSPIPLGEYTFEPRTAPGSGTFCPARPVSFDADAAMLPRHERAPWEPAPRAHSRLLALAEAVYVKPPSAEPAGSQAVPQIFGAQPRLPRWNMLEPQTRSGAVSWKRWPFDLKLLTVVLPVAALLAFSPSLLKLRAGNAATNGVRGAVTNQLVSFRQGIVSRAGVEYSDDFRAGLEDWQGRANTTAHWSYDATGFVRPGSLALFRPTLKMKNYRFEFLGGIDQKAMACVFRASDLDNYYAVKFIIVKPGPIPLIRLARYAVVNGKESARQERPLPVPARNDTLYRVLIDVRGGDFTIMAQGKVVDFWSDSRLKRGGVGLFCGRGEKSRVRWVEVAHQYDALGRLCAYLAPYGGSGNWN